MSAPVTMVVTIDALPGEEKSVGDALLGVVKATRAEPGCVQYDLHRHPHHIGRFVFYETWATRDAWEAHDNAAHIVGLKAALDGRTEEAKFLWLDKIEP